MIQIAIMKSDDIIQDSTHYDHYQGIGKIVQNYHYVHFSLNAYTLQQTFENIMTSYSILSHRENIEDTSLLKQASVLINEISQTIQQIKQLIKK